MKASATALLAGGRGKELLIQVYIYVTFQFVIRVSSSAGHIRSRILVIVSFMPFLPGCQGSPAYEPACRNKATYRAAITVGGEAIAS
jgi:hypothetical protein